MIEVNIRVKQKEGLVPAYAEAYEQWVVDTPITKEEAEKMIETLRNAEKFVTTNFLTMNKRI